MRSEDVRRHPRGNAVDVGRSAMGGPMSDWTVLGYRLRLAYSNT